MFDDAITNYERNIMIQTSAIKFNHRTIIALGSQSRLFIEIRCGVEDTGSRPRTGMLEVKAKYLEHKRKCSEKKENVFQKIFQAIYKI